MPSLVRLLLGLALAAGVGCGSDSPKPPDMGGEDGKQIAALVDEMGDTSATKVKGLFAGGAVSKADGAKYVQNRYDLKGKPEVSGSTATAKVEVTKNATGQSAGEKEWTFVKEGEKWKIKAAPLP